MLYFKGLNNLMGTIIVRPVLLFWGGGEGVDVTFWFLSFGLRSLKIDCIFWMQKGHGTFFWGWGRWGEVK